MDNQFFAELSRRLREDGISTGEETKRCLPVLLNGQVVMNVAQSSEVFAMPGALDTPEANELYHQVAGTARLVKEYTQAMELAPPLKGISLDEPYRLLADFNGTVLAGHEVEHGGGYLFATWDWDFNRKGVNRGEYFPNRYEAAKRDFALRSGLIPESLLFTDEQLTEVYRCIREELESGYDIPEERRRTLQSAAEQIERSVPHLEELVMRSNQQELELNM